jgi:hypothetical protein
MRLSIKLAKEQREALEAEAKKVWNDLAEALMARIPDSCRKFATENGWYKCEIDNWWGLPKFLENMVSNSELGSCNSNKYYEKDLEPYGFTSFDDLETKLKELEKVWSDVVRIDIHKSEGHRVEVCYYAIEFEPGSDEA